VSTRLRGRRCSARWVLFLWALLLLLGGPGRAQDFEAVRIESTDLGSGLFMLTGRGGNLLASVGEDGSFVVDDQFAPLSPKILAAIRELGPGPLRFVLNTHWHGDHTGGNENMARAGALVIAHDKVRLRMSRDHFNAAANRRIEASPEAALPVLTFDHGLTLHLNGETVRLHHVAPAHTDGDSFVHLVEADVIHTGDLYFAGRYPYIDLSSGGRVDGMIEAAERILALSGEQTKIVPGHGPLSSRAELADWRDMLVGVRERVRAEIAAGKDAEAVQAARPSADWDARYGGGFMTPERFVAVVDASLRAPSRAR